MNSHIEKFSTNAAAKVAAVAATAMKHKKCDEKGKWATIFKYISSEQKTKLCIWDIECQAFNIER